jgi:hypothetical protein
MAVREKHPLDQARSFRRGTVDSNELKRLAKISRGRDDLEEMAAAMQDFDGDAYVIDGDLVVDGDFDTKTFDAIWLFVAGNVKVNGFYKDNCESGPDHVFIGKDLIAQHIITAANLDVMGSIHCTGALVGDYNDGGLHVRGNVQAKLFALYDHPYRIEGKTQATFTLGRGQPEKGEVNWVDVPLAVRFDEEMLIQRICKGLPLFSTK